MYLLGDFNLCYSRDDGMVKSYKRMIASFSIKQIIDQATRITATTSTIIDHFLTNCYSKIRICGVLNCSFSDHQIIYGVRGSVVKQASSPLVKNIRSFKNYSKTAFCDLLKSESWSPVLLAPTQNATRARISSRSSWYQPG